MSALKDAAFRIARAGLLPMLPTERLTHMERVSAQLAMRKGSARDRSNAKGEDWETVAGRLDFGRIDAGRPADVRRAIDAIWRDEGRTAQADGLVAQSLAAERKSYDLALILAYLRHFPLDHPAFEALNAAAGTAAERHAWIWRERGRRWHLWDEDRGPDAIAQALLGTDDPMRVLQEAGLDGEVAEGGFVLEALEDACDLVGATRGGEAELLGQRLIGLFDRLAVGEADAPLAYALLNPWTAGTPSEAHRTRIGGLLVKRIGDPRFDTGRWAVLLAELRERMPGFDPRPMLDVLIGWLTQATVREFFRVVARTTDDPKQWSAREAFWLAYLDAGIISKAWFAFGAKAEDLVVSLGEKSSVGAGKIIGSSQYANPSHSSLVLEIGNQIIAEWSHSGGCRFWMSDDVAHAPEFYKKTYFGYQLRAMNGGPGFDHIDHKGRWEVKFARRIFEKTGVRHPVYKDGWIA